jgi:hypothetical protein
MILRRWKEPSKMKIIRALAIGCLVVPLVAGRPAIARDVREACMGDIATLCPREFFARDREKIRTCLKANLDKASPGCQEAARAKAREACQDDLKTLCPGELASGDRSKIRACLNAQIEKASPGCQSAVKG